MASLSQRKPDASSSSEPAMVAHSQVAPMPAATATDAATARSAVNYHPAVQTRSTSRPVSIARKPSVGASSGRDDLASGGLARRPALDASPDRLRRPSALLSTGASLPLLRMDDAALVHHRSDSGRSTGSSRSNTTGESLFLSNASRSYRSGKSGARPSSSQGCSQASHSGSLARRTSITIESSSLSQGHLARRESWASTTPTSPEDEEGPHYGGSDSADREEAHAEAKRALARLSDGFGTFWDSSDYSYGDRRGSGRSNTDVSLPPLILAGAPIPPSRSESLDPLAVPLEQDAGSSLLTILDAYAHSWSTGTSPHGHSSSALSDAAIGSGDGGAPSSEVQAELLTHSASDRAGWTAEGTAPISSPESRRQSAQGLPPSASAPLSTLRPALLAPDRQSTATLHDPSIEARSERGNASTSSLSGPSAPASPKAQHSFNVPPASKAGTSQTSKSLRSAFSRSARSFRNSLMWTAQPDQGLGVYTAFGASSHSLSPSTISSLAPSPQLGPGHLPTPSTKSLTPCSPTRSDFSLSVRSSREDSISEAMSMQRDQKHASGHSPSYSTHTHVPAMTGADARAEALDLGRSASGVNLAEAATSTEDQGIRHVRSKSRFSSRFSFHDQPWTRTLNQMTGKKAPDAAKPARKAGTVRAPKARDETLGAERGPEAPGMQRGRSQSVGQLQQMFTARTAETKPSDSPPAPDGQPRGLGDAGLALTVPASPVLFGQPPSPDPQISPSFAATFSFLNSALWQDSDDVFVVAREAETTAPGSGHARAAKSDLGHTTQSHTMHGRRDGPSGRQADRVGPRVEASPTPAPSASGLTASSTVRTDASSSPSASRNGLELSSWAPDVSPSGPHRKTHRKQKSLDPAALITMAAKEAAAEIDARSRAGGDLGRPIAAQRSSSLYGGMTASTTMASYETAASSSALLSPEDERATFFDALTSPAAETPPPSSNLLAGFEATGASPVDAPVEGARDSAISAAAADGDPAADTRRRHRSLSRTLSVVLEPLIVKSRPPSVKSRPPSIKGPSSPMRGGFELVEPPQMPARPETSLGFSLRKALRRERTASGNEAVAAVGRKAKAAPTAVRSAGAPKSDAPKSSVPATGREEQPLTTKASGIPTLPRIPSAREVPRAASAATRTPEKRQHLLPHPAAEDRTPSTPDKLRAASEFGSPLSARSRSPGKALSPPSSYRAPLPRPKTASNFARPAPTLDRAGTLPLRSGRKPAASTATPAFSSSSSSTSPPTMDRYAAPDEPSPRMQSRIAASKAIRSTTNSSRSVSDKSLSSGHSLNSSSSASTITSRSSEVKRRTGDTRRSSMHQTDAAERSAPGPRAPARRERTKSKPNLPSIKTKLDGASVPAPLRSASSLDVRNGGAGRRKMSQPSLDIADDKEFLEALEQVRAVNRQRIAAEAAEAEKEARLARLGMASGVHPRTRTEHAGPSIEDDARGRALHRPASSLSMASRRSASADARLAPGEGEREVRADRRSVDEVQKAIVRANADRKPVLTTAVSGLEWGVGKASGKLRDGAFVNDDDWKKEVKALFLIRELVQTERSYARHLASLLTAVRKLSTTAAASAASTKRKTSGNLFATYSPSSGSKYLPGTLPQHLATLRTFLPQLIALSRGLIQRVEANPTSAGVGAAFEVLGAQLQATFVNWSTIVPSLMDAVRAAEAPKAKLAFKLGLIPLLPPDQTEVGESTVPGANNSPTSPTNPRAVEARGALERTRTGPSSTTYGEPGSSMPPPPLPTRSERRESDGKTMPMLGSRAGKRRSTITSAFVDPPSSSALLGSKRAGSSTRPTSPTGEHASRLPSRPSSPWGQLASLTMPRNTAGLGRSAAADSPQTPHATPIATRAAGDLHLASSTLSSTSHASASAASLAAVKSLSPMDIVIMPTQRLPRYGLMLRDLLSNTPPQSLSHARVQRALGSIQRVALLCDAASNTAKTGHDAGVGGGGGRRSVAPPPSSVGSSKTSKSSQTSTTTASSSSLSSSSSSAALAAAKGSAAARR
ncbi:uncharacterized protein PFL1_01978 [Pseudozyma flocculosa PF-1]|uniref:uncharacterized protein n=1 Tax=Pseudozyma flocculosa PF-1 TaxID=1277687 RepID=UPI0004561500|nr:uncharacterized protein PFL1_01978 [Pseudozyma flocculosa PF-1]EPQ30452.1 hypothetical protein PFL1_01978 [Pseudozyma flocculosa PF-1]